MNAFVQALRNLGPVRLLALAGVGIASVAFFGYLMSRLGAPQMGMLYGDLELADSSRIVSELQTRAVPHKVRAGGAEILVPVDQIASLRLAMAGQDLPRGGSMGYELFDRSETFGSSNFVQQINHLRALEGELSRTIASISSVRAARVHLVLPRRQPFSREQQEATASIILKMGRGARLDRPQVLAIQHLVAAAVPGLSPTSVSVVDDRGTLLARSVGEGSGADLGGISADERRLAYENRLRRKILEILEPIVGPGKVRAEVTAEMDFDRITTSTESYDPNGQVVRSVQTVEESADSSQREASDPVSVGENIPGSPEAELGDGSTASDRSNRLEEVTNYEISKTVTSQTRETGLIKRLSIAVMVDGAYSVPADGGAATYEPRPEEQMAQLNAMVRSTVGYDEGRGDTVEVVNMQFTELGDVVTPDDVSSFLPRFAKQDYFRLAEILVLAVVAVLVILLVVRPLMRRLLDATSAVAAADGVQGDNLLSDQSPEVGALTGPASGKGQARQATPLGVAEEEEEDDGIDIEQIEGQVKISSIKKINAIIDRHPDEAVSIIRNWMIQGV